jgi:hypothetical protein
MASGKHERQVTFYAPLANDTLECNNWRSTYAGSRISQKRGPKLVVMARSLISNDLIFSDATKPSPELSGPRSSKNLVVAGAGDCFG